MKQFLFIPIFAFCTAVYAQVPRQESTLGVESEGIAVEAPPSRTVAADEVRGISYEKDGKKSFLMGNESKIGLYDEIRYAYNTNSYIVKKGKLYGIANKKAEITAKIAYDSIAVNNFTGAGFVVKQQGKYGKIDASGAIILPIVYHKILAGNQEVTLVKNEKDEMQLVLNGQNKTLRAKIEYVELYQNLALVKSGGKFGIVKDELVLPFAYDSIFIPTKDPKHIPVGSSKTAPKSKGPNPLLRLNQTISHLTLQQGDKYGLIDSEAKVIYPVDNDEVYNAENFGYYSVKKGALFGIYFFKSKDKKKTEIEFDHIRVDGYGAVMASKNNKMGIFNLNGEAITAFEYDNDFIAQYSGIGYRVSKDKKRGIIDHQGKTIVAPIYDDVSTLSYSNRTVFKVKNGEKYGIVNRENKVIVPVEFEYIDELDDKYLVVTPERKVGLYDKDGNIVVPVTYKWITKTATPGSRILILNKEDYSFNFLDQNNAIILPENCSEYGYVLDEQLLKNPTEQQGLLYVKTKSGKLGLLDEMAGTLVVPTVYDEIIQSATARQNQRYFSVRKGKKYGLINRNNEVILPVKYDAIDLTFALSTVYFNEEKETENDFQVVVAKGKKYGTVNLKNEVVIPLQYAFLQRLWFNGLFKAKKGKHYQIIDKDGKPISENTFDEVANFEQLEDAYSEEYRLQALTFANGKMRVIDNKGNFITSEQSMQPHTGYATFDELKSDLIKVLDDKQDVLLSEFVDKIAPSDHILYYLKQNIFDQSDMYVDVENVRKKYLHDLLDFKHNKWNEANNSGYNRSSLYVIDYTIYSERYGIVTNTRTSDHAYGDTRFMEKLLRDAIKVNGYWISTYFMTRGFDRY